MPSLHIFGRRITRISTTAEIVPVGVARPDKFSRITQNNSIYAIQGYSRSSILIPVDSHCNLFVNFPFLKPLLTHSFVQETRNITPQCGAKHVSISLTVRGGLPVRRTDGPMLAIARSNVRR